MDKTIIINIIDRRVKEPSYPTWNIGVTTRPDECKWEHRVDRKYWKVWPVDSERSARAVEAYFLSKGMRGGNGSVVDSGRPIYVYIF